LLVYDESAFIICRGSDLRHGIIATDMYICEKKKK